MLQDEIALMASVAGANLEPALFKMPVNAQLAEDRPEALLQRFAQLLHVDIPEVWLRFLLALVGLVLAFGAALFSSVSRESGNLWATLILASAALLLATIVGLTTVPYLARRVSTIRLRDAFDYDVTRVGIIYVVTILLIGIAALN